eukprot:gb/GEZN01013147.1/.p1 GENE.gb/GEZN01013147.1/~~gb/GEZN01013147.1/.p1  ORF type:complete len:260 (-),score=39.45 gb/GEZN01013147.1/:80-859(-)
MNTTTDYKARNATRAAGGRKSSMPWAQPATAPLTQTTASDPKRRSSTPWADTNSWQTVRQAQQQAQCTHRVRAFQVPCYPGRRPSAVIVVAPAVWLGQLSSALETATATTITTVQTITRHLKEDPAATEVEKMEDARHGTHNVRPGPLGYLNRCPHAGIPLEMFEDDFQALDDPCLLQCSSHWARFQSSSGTCVSGPCEGAKLASIPLISVFRPKHTLSCEERIKWGHTGAQGEKAWLEAKQEMEEWIAIAALVSKSQL